MILTLNVDCIGSLVSNGARRGEGGIALSDVGRFVAHELGLAGLSLPTRLLSGIDRAGLEALREQYDKARCSCLQLIETTELPLASHELDAAENALNRVTRVMQAAHFLGCNSAAICVAGEDKDDVLNETALALRRVIPMAERLELNLLVAPRGGLTSTPERVTELLKRVGGFRLGTFPDFASASRAKDAAAYLRRLTPYASVVSATTMGFDDNGPFEPLVPTVEEDEDGPGEAFEEVVPVHTAYDLAPMLAALRSVGYDGTLAIDFQGPGNPVDGVARSKSAMEHALRMEVEES